MIKLIFVLLGIMMMSIALSIFAHNLPSTNFCVIGICYLIGLHYLK